MQIAHIKPGMAAHACHPNTWKTEARQLVLGQPELHGTLSKKKKSLHRDNTPKNVKMALNHAYSLSIWGLIYFPIVILQLVIWEPEPGL